MAVSRNGARATVSRTSGADRLTFKLKPTQVTPKTSARSTTRPRTNIRGLGRNDKDGFMRRLAHIFYSFLNILKYSFMFLFSYFYSFHTHFRENILKQFEHIVAVIIAQYNIM